MIDRTRRPIPCAAALLLVAAGLTAPAAAVRGAEGLVESISADEIV